MYTRPLCISYLNRPHAKKNLQLNSSCLCRLNCHNFFFFHHSYAHLINKICFSFFPFAVTKFIRIGIADKNDNPPYFDKNLYEAEVDENEDIQHTVLTVTAKDHDECKYMTTIFIIPIN